MAIKFNAFIRSFPVDLLLKATGDAPIMKQKKWTVEADRNVGSIIIFIKRYLKLDSSESLVSTGVDGKIFIVILERVVQ